jgi:hypothetical protein
MAEQKTEPTQKKDGIPEIHAHESNRRYRLIGKDKTEIERTAAELFQGSNLLANQTLWVSNFRATLSQVRTWCDMHKEVLRLALVDVRSSKVVFYFVPDSARYDLPLGKQMTDLEVNLRGSAGLGYVETLQVPERSIERFVGENSGEIWRRESDAR